MATLLESEALQVSPHVMALHAGAADGFGKPLAKISSGGLDISVQSDRESVWVLIRRKNSGGLALRAVFSVGDFECTPETPSEEECARFTVRSAIGKHTVALKAGSGELEHLRLTVSLEVSNPTSISYMPRDLYALGKDDDPLTATGNIEATQRGFNSALLYLHFEQPAFGSVLYFQNLTALNDYFRRTATKPSGAVGGEWPELGYLLPVPPESAASSAEGLTPGAEVVISDAILVFREDSPPHERESARRFLQMLAAAYKMLERPAVEYRDWMERAERTLRDLDEAPEATIKHYGHRYIHPYTAAEYPDIMVQMSIVAAIHDWGKWGGEPHPLEAEFKAGLNKFYDAKLETLRRYLPNVGDDKDADAIDSWYLYHPLLNLGNLALDGDADARKLLLKSIGFGIRAAQHFKYKWPIQYNTTDFSVITEDAGDGRGQTDVGGIYAWVMLQAFELTGDKSFLDEARNAIDAAMGLRFDVNYQANLTAWGAAACARLWRVTNQRVYLEQSYVYLASFFHNSQIWESDIDLAEHYSNFMAVTCLQDAPYMAIYECFDSFSAFERYFNDSGPDLDPAARMLIAEYCKYALYRTWFYYPDALPPEALSPKQRETNGHIDRSLSFPVEDLYPDGQLAGQVGQEVYGAGAAFIFATRAFREVDGAPFRLYCDHFIRVMERTGTRTAILALAGGETMTAGLHFVRVKRRKLEKINVRTAGGDVLTAISTSPDRIEFEVPANGRLILTWA